jgi:hypothetical protein
VIGQLLAVSDIGIDISGVQDASVVTSDDWIFVVVKTTESPSVVDPLADEQWAAIMNHLCCQ